MQIITERPARGAGAAARSKKGVHNLNPLKGGQTVPTLSKGTQIVHPLQNGVLKIEQALKGTYRASALFTPLGRRRQKLIPRGVPFDDLSPGQQKAVRSLRKLREQMAAEIERMIAFLDETDGYSTIEVEEDDADPTDAALRRAAPASAGTLDDDEPVLGFTENHPDCWDELGGYCFAYRSDEPGGRQDLEQGSDDDREGGEHDGREPDDDREPDDGDFEDGADDEPSLGWTDVETRCGRYVNNGNDFEIDEARA
jgi:hypothetical protein